MRGTRATTTLDFLLVALEKSFFNITRSCDPTLISYVWKNASDIFGTSEMHVVGLTPSMYAITDGDSVVYHSMIGANVQTAAHVAVQGRHEIWHLGGAQQRRVRHRRRGR
jgi:hypothetical protein